MQVTKLGTRLALFFVIASTIGCDRITKHYAATTLAGTPARSFVSDLIRFEYAENPGGFLSLGADLPPAARTGLFTVGTGLILLTVVATLTRMGWTGWSLVGVALYFAGAASNWIDRIVRGSVIDFVNIGLGPLRTGVFNVADVAIMGGILLLVVGHYRKYLDAAYDPSRPGS